jgi:glutamate--cysteine ligase
VLDLARRALEISAHGLQRPRPPQRNGADESIYLRRMMEFAEGRHHRRPRRKLEQFHGAWRVAASTGGSREYAY